MHPLTVISGVILGSCLSIAVSLTVVSIIFLILGGKYPQLQHEFEPLLKSVLLFISMTAISGWSFWTLVKNRREKWLGQAAMWLGLAGIAFYYWP
jgi:hypothetical protein